MPSQVKAKRTQTHVAKRRGTRPFVKWAGGKGQLLAQLEPYVPPFFNRYYEPFLGGGAMFFHLQPEDALISDSNSDLMNAYEVVRSNVEELIAALAQHRNDEAYFYSVRSQDPAQLSHVEQAARFIYLNKTCYNGLYRVNRQGQFNVPFGKYASPLICDERVLRGASEVLGSTELLTADFEEALREADHHDFVYLDPPYDPLSHTSRFTSYTQDGFDERDQERLANVIRELYERGVFVLLNNSDTPFIRELYADFNIAIASAKRAINSNGDGRGAINELVITTYSSETLNASFRN